ncbi:Glycine/D-amino acid oxidase [Microbulbifer donghaiensis]|uniref:Glycine/D-amino acid oxidase n=1 Tax=Microbulbifer donghaiensis TaxID=494016 RepID=A0A1M5AUI2_9GAMM|nr:FAD-dependent oxidoreductase [Microbulbifer donghaiensis]SHF33883.1 Glycine/D-amino acid oxidase [Microbulbifer donghaiensis]
MDRDYRHLSYWFDKLNEVVTPRAPLTRNLEVDVAIAGAGFTGLWTAYYLKKLAPELSIAILEAETAGFGASGRNGGWLMSALEGSGAMLRELAAPQADTVRAQILGIIPEVERVLKTENIDCDFQRGGGLFAAARFPEQRTRALALLDDLHAQGFGEKDYRWLDAPAATALVNVRGCRGGIYTPHIATINPAKLVRALANAVEAMGVQIFERTPAVAVASRCLETPSARVRARTVVSALEAYSATARTKLARHTIPVASKILVTEPLSSRQWQELGFSTRPAFSDLSRLISYAQRTADGRLLFGARGSYEFGAKIRRDAALSVEEIAQQRRYLLDFFPQLEDARITHAWAGSLGIPRAYRPHASFDPDSGLALGGGYVGEGVGAANLIARTLADLILQRGSDLCAMPWAHIGPAENAVRRWEPEPLRWLAYKTINRVFAWEEQLYLRALAPQWQKWIAAATADRLEKLMH